MRRIVLLFALFLAACGDGPAPSSIPILFVGLDGADWELLDGYMAAGDDAQPRGPGARGADGDAHHDPAAALAAGVDDDDDRASPRSSTASWTSPGCSSGDAALSSRSPAPSGGCRRCGTWPATGGKSVAVFGLWATWPAEPVRGLMVADRFLSFTSRDAQPPPGTVHPAEREPWAREALAKAERAVELAALRAYLPWSHGLRSTTRRLARA